MTTENGTTTTTEPPPQPEAPPAPPAPEPQPKPETAVATAQQRRDLPMDPETFTQAWRMAEAFARSTLLPQALRNRAADVFHVLMMGRDLGISPTQAFKDLHVIDGKVGMAADLMAALVHKSGLCAKLDIVEWDDKVCRIECQRRNRDGSLGPIVVGKFTIEEARRIPHGFDKDTKKVKYLADKDNWQNYAPDMLRNRATARGCRAVWPDVVRGCYEQDEIEEIHAATVRVVEPDPLAPGKSKLDDLKDTVRARRAAETTTPPPADTSKNDAEPEESSPGENPPPEKVPPPAPASPPPPKPLAERQLEDVLSIARTVLEPTEVAALLRKHNAKAGVLGMGLSEDARKALKAELVTNVERLQRQPS